MLFAGISALSPTAPTMDRRPDTKRPSAAARAADKPQAAPRITPEGELDEAGMHGVLGYQLAQASIAALQSFAQAVGKPHDLRTVEYSVLSLIAHNPGTSPGRLASALALTKPNVTLWLDRLEARGLIERRPSPTDGRALALSATTEGARLAARATADLLVAEQQQFDRLSAAERAMLTELLHRFAAQR